MTVKVDFQWGFCHEFMKNNFVFHESNIYVFTTRFSNIYVIQNAKNVPLVPFCKAVECFD